MRLSRRDAARVVALGAAALAYSACSSHGRQDKAPDHLTIGLMAEPATLDFTTSDGASIPQVLLGNVYQNLVSINDKGVIVPQLATRWEVSEDRRSYLFNLRPDVTFNDGSPFTADSVKFSIDRVNSPATSIGLKSAMAVVDRVEVITPTQVRVVLSRPSQSWLYSMTTRIGAMLTPTGVQHMATTPVGTGPYRLARWNRGDSIVLTRRPEAAQRNTPFMSEVTFRYFADSIAMDNAMLSGGISMMVNPTPETLPRFDHDGRFRVITGPTNAEVVLSFNNARGPLTDRRLRQAITYAVDRRAVRSIAAEGRGELIGSMVPPTDPWYEDLTGLYPFNPARARALLTQIGHPIPPLRLRVPNLPYAQTAAQVVQSQLRDVGIPVTIDVLEFPARWLNTVLKHHDYDMSIVAHVEARDIVQFAHPNYYFGYNDPVVQRLVAQGDAGTARQYVDDMRAVARRIAENAAADWLWLQPYIVVADSRLTGIPTAGINEGFDVTHIAMTGPAS